MPSKILKKKPLIEAILEVKWKLQEPQPGLLVDPNYKILPGRFYDKLISEYVFHEPLPSSNVPDEISGHVVKHRFRVSKEGWPLVQIGPGILSVNDTDNYTWDDFRIRCCKVLELLYELYPNPEELEIEGLLLRYIDGIEFDFDKENPYDFLDGKLKTKIVFPSTLFEDGNVNSSPLGFNLVSTFKSKSPRSAVIVRFGRGKRKETDCIIWETMVQSVGEDIPKMPEGFENWIVAAHDIADDWFFKFIEGELEEMFE